MGTILVLLQLTECRTLEVHETAVAPRVDGVIEDLWLAADSTAGFTQITPYEGQPGTDRTIVWVMQDAENLYIALRCHCDKNPATALLTGSEDDIAVGLDPFDNRTSAYYFTMYGSGIPDDGLILDDGRTHDGSWDGVWYSAIHHFPDRYEVEFKIPFKSIRYRHGAAEWGIQFKRYVDANHEVSYWNEVTSLEEDMVSKFGRLTGVKPRSSGYYFELYPEGYVRYDRQTGLEDEYHPRISLNAKWDITPQITVNGTILPDFAQIESDPYRLNLSRYDQYLDERRPFFLEGQDIFRMSDFGDNKGFHTPLRIFYSRMVGRSIDGDAVPIIGGFKATTKSQTYNLGLLAAYTDEYLRISDTGDTLSEPQRCFGVLRAKKRLFHSSDLGIMFAGTAAQRDDYNYAVGVDAVLRSGPSQFIFQGAGSDRAGKRGWATSAGYMGFNYGILTLGGVEWIDDSFDVAQIGYVPWAGQKKLLVFSGPFRTFERGWIENIFVAPGICVVQEPGDTNISTIGGIEMNPNFRNDWGFDFSFLAGPYYEADTHYLYRTTSLSVWGQLLGEGINFGGDLSHTYNYYRDLLGYQSTVWAEYRHPIIDNLSVTLNSYLWTEWDTSNTVVAMTPVLYPRLDIRFNAKIQLALYSQLIFATPGSHLAESEFAAARNGLLFSWNFTPKSWFYVAVNDYREQNPASGAMEQEYLIGAVKAKYLLYF